jgi:acyl-CoA thioester hydrolase
MSETGAAGLTGRVLGYAVYLKVRHYEMDALGHVNNAVYLNYLEQAAVEHAAALGFTFERLRALGGLFIARRHEIEYLRPATAGDVVQVATWLGEMRGAQAVRDYAISVYRQAADALTHETAAVPADHILPAGAVPDGPLLVRARTVWAWVDSERGRPRRIPAEVLAAFAP